MKLDFHNHILPGLDDGARTLEESVELVAAMKSWGFERITCTPHIMTRYMNTPDTIKPAFELLREELDRKGIDIELKMSAEYRLVPETWPEVLEKKWLMPIEDRFILMELPINDPYEIKNIKPIEEFRRIVSMGLTPILPHPERYFYMSYDELMRYVDEGVQIQVNYGSIAGLYGAEAQANAQRIVDMGIVSLYGTDMHNMHYVKVIGDYFAAGNPIADYAVALNP